MTIRSGEELLHDAVHEAYFIDTFLAERVQTFSKRCESPELRRAMDRFVDAARDNVDRTEVMLAVLSAEARRGSSPAIQGMIDQIEDKLDAIESPSLRDVALDVGMEAVHQFEAWRYRSVRDWADAMGLSTVSELISQNCAAIDDVRCDFEAARRSLAPVAASD